MNEQCCPDCGGEMERVYTVDCELCDWSFTHPEYDAVDMQFIEHLVSVHDVKLTELHVETQ